MQAKLSPLELKELFITHFSSDFAHPGKELDIAGLFAAYPVEVDFGIKHLDNGLHQVALKVQVNKMEELHPGYAISIECLGFYAVNESELEEKSLMPLLASSGVSMNLSFVRSFIMNHTAHLPMGKYILPSIDLSDLIRQRLQIQSEAGQQKAKAKARK